MCALMRSCAHACTDDWVCVWAAGDDHDAPHVDAHPMPFNPFMITGSLVTCSLLGRAHLLKRDRLFTDSASRFSHLLTGIQVRVVGGWDRGLGRLVDCVCVLLS